MDDSYLRSTKKLRAWTIFIVLIVIALVAVTFYLTAVYGGAHMIFNCVFGVFALGVNLYLLFTLNRGIKEHEAKYGHV